MVLNKTKWVTYCVAFCFAILQALQPFIHGHLDADQPIQHHGFHVGNEFEEAVIAHINTQHTLAAAPSHFLHTISVASGIKQDSNLTVTPDILGLMLMVVFLVVSLQIATVRYSRLTSFPYPPLKRRLPAPRAPPQH